jgi:allantoin racemase
MTDLCAHIEQVLGVPVIDGVAAGTKLIESLVKLKLRTSKRGELARPLPKTMVGALEGFTLARP